jgi:cell division protein FtsB
MTDQKTKPSTTTRIPASARRPSTIQVVLLVILAIGLPLAIDFRRRIEQGQSITADRQELEASIATLEAEQHELEAERAYVTSDTFVEAWAHDQGKMVREGERLVIPIPQGEPIVEQPIQRGASEPISNWQVWWSLFFDGSPPF